MSRCRAAGAAIRDRSGGAGIAVGRPASRRLLAWLVTYMPGPVGGDLHVGQPQVAGHLDVDVSPIGTGSAAGRR